MLQSSIHEFPFTATVHDLQDFPLKRIDAILGDDKWSGWTWERIRTTWIEPRYIEKLSDLEAWVTSHLILLRNTEDPAQVVAVYPVCSKGVHATISLARTEESEEKGLYLRARKISDSISAEKLRAAVVVVRSDAGTRDTHNVVAMAVRMARDWLYKLEGAGEPEAFVGLKKKSPLEGVGFCTWSSIGEGKSLSHHSRRSYTDLTVQASNLPSKTSHPSSLHSATPPSPFNHSCSTTDGSIPGPTSIQQTAQSTPTSPAGTPPSGTLPPHLPSGHRYLALSPSSKNTSRQSAVWGYG
jgi:hypothetical protein